MEQKKASHLATVIETVTVLAEEETQNHGRERISGRKGLKRVRRGKAVGATQGRSQVLATMTAFCALAASLPTQVVILAVLYVVFKMSPWWVPFKEYMDTSLYCLLQSSVNQRLSQNKKFNFF